MSRRCKPGKKARILGGLNSGRVVLVVRALHGQDFEGSLWPEAIYPWVVSGIGGPLRTRDLETKLENPPRANIVECDLRLEPFDDEEDGQQHSTERRKPVKAPVPLP